MNTKAAAFLKKLGIEADVSKLPLQITFKGEASLSSREEANNWLQAWNWAMAARVIRAITVGHAGHQLRVWVGWSSGLSSFEGGHFDTSEDKMFDVHSDDPEVIQYVLAAIKERTGINRWMTFNADVAARRDDNYRSPLQVIIPG